MNGREKRGVWGRIILTDMRWMQQAEFAGRGENKTKSERESLDHVQDEPRTQRPLS